VLVGALSVTALAVTAGAYWNAAKEARSHALAGARALAQVEASRLAMVAERVAEADPSLLAELLLLSATDLRVLRVEVIGPDGRVAASTQAGQRQRPPLAEQALVFGPLSGLVPGGPAIEALQHDGRMLTLAQSFAWPAQGRELRSDRFGVVVVDIDLQGWHAAAHADTLRDLPMTALLWLLSAGLLYVGLERGMVRPLDRLRAAADALGQGDWGQRMPMTRVRELQQVGRSFNRMAAELRRTIGRLSASEERYRDLINAAPDAIVTVDVLGRIESFNHAAELLFGHPASAMLGQPLDRLLPLEARERHRDHLHRFTQAGEHR